MSQWRRHLNNIGGIPWRDFRMVRVQCSPTANHFNPFLPRAKMLTVSKEFGARLANRRFLVFDFRALWRAILSALQNARKMVG